MSSAAAVRAHEPVTVWLTPDKIDCTPLRSAYDWWQTLRGDRRFPSRQEMKPRDMRDFLPYMSLVKVIDSGADFEHRIVGDVMVQAFNIRIHQRRFSEIADDCPELIEKSLVRFRKVVNTAEPVCWRDRAGYADSYMVFTDSEVLLLPLGVRQDTVDHVVGFGFHQRQFSGA